MEHRALALAHFKQALKKFHRGEVKDGLTALEEAIRLNPDRWEFFWTRGAFNYRRSAYPQALSDLTKAIDLCPETELAAKIYQRRMFCYGRLERFDSLVEDATWLIEHGFFEANIYEWRGWGKYMMGEVESAIADYSQVLDSSPADFLNRLYRATLYYRLERYNDALDDLDYAFRYSALGMILLSPPSSISIVHQYRALIFYHQGELEKSLNECNHAQELTGFPPFSSIEAYADSIKDGIEHSFSGMPSRPPERHIVIRRGHEMNQV